MKLTLAPRLEELARQIQGLRGDLQQLDKHVSENFASLRNEMIARIDGLRAEMDSRFETVNTRIDALSSQVNGRIDALSQRLDDALNIRERLVAVETKLAARSN